MKKRPGSSEIKRVALSLRVSTEGQVDGHSLDTQEMQLRSWAEREGWEVIEVYTDAGRSAFRKVEGREAFLRMIDDAEAGKFDAVLVLKSDRFMRGAGHARVIRDRLASAGVQYKSLQEPGAWDGTPGGFLLGSNADTYSEYYSLELSVKMTMNLRTRAEKGLTLGDVPFGYLRDEPQQPIYPCPSEAGVVLRMFERYQSGQVSMAELAEELNALGLRPRSKQGKKRFSAASVKGMLRNPVYAGFVTRHGEILRDGLHEAIVPRDLFDRVQRVIDERARRPRVHARRPPHPYLLAGIAFCIRCGGPLWANSAAGGAYHYYRCAADRRGELCDDGGLSARVESPDGALARMFEAMRLPPRWQERVCELTHETTDIESTEEQRRYWADQVKRAKDGFKVGLLDLSEAEEMKRESEMHLRRLEAFSTSAAIEVAPVLTDICEAWPQFTAEERRAAARITLEAVGLDVRTGRIEQVLPRPSFEPLFRAVAEIEGGAVGFCDWRPRADSNRRSPP